MGFSVYRISFIYPRLEAFQEVLKLSVINVPSLIGDKNKQEQNLRILQVVPINNSRARGPFNHDLRVNFLYCIHTRYRGHIFSHEGPG